MAVNGSILWVGRIDGVSAHAVAESTALEVAWVRDVEEACSLPLQGFAGVVLDAPDAATALRGLQRLRSRAPHVPVVVRLPGEEDERAEELESAGAVSVSLRRAGEAPGAVLGEMQAVLAQGRPARRSRPSPLLAAATDPTRRMANAPAGVVGCSRAMASVFALVERAARSRATVLLTGETGTGKELLARAIHEGHPRRGAPFVAVNCAAFPDTLLESELFGHLRGAFTGADRSRKGLFETADGGTLFLDEVAETSPSLQAKLLRVLQEREVRPVGGSQARQVDVRLVAATNRELESEVARGRLREDLYYRLAVFPIAVPPLRQRREDVLPLADHFLARHGMREDKPDCRLSREAADLLLAHTWPGNVRELENEIQRALALVSAGDEITPHHLSERVREALEPVAAAAREGETLRETMARIEAWLVRRALAAHDGRRAATARALGVTREGLYKKMKRWHIE